MVIAELVQPVLESEVDVRKMRLVEHQLADVQLKLRTGQHLGNIGRALDATVTFWEYHVGESAKIQRQASEGQREQPDRLQLRRCVEVGRLAGASGRGAAAAEP